MTEHKPLPVHGYQAQSKSTIDYVNRNKMLEERVLRIIDEVADPVNGFDLRWASIARTDIEKGFMALNRSIFQPKRIEGELE